MTIAFFSVDEENKPFLEDQFSDHKLLFIDDGLTLETAQQVAEAEIISVFIHSDVTSDVINSLPNVKAITTRSTGFDHIDVEYARSKGIAVMNVPTYGARTVAEFAMGLMLTLSRNIFQAYHDLREGNLQGIKHLRGFDLNGKTLGIIGCGNIGRNVVKMARGFDMNVLVFDVHPDDAFAEEYGFRYTDFDEVVSQSDIISLHVPHNEHTHHMINADNLHMFKQGSYLINTSRGEVVDTPALMNALKNGPLAGAGLDVVEGEGGFREEMEVLLKGQENTDKIREILYNHMLIDMPNVVVTPHIAFNSREATHEILTTTAENIKSVLNGAPQNTV